MSAPIEKIQDGLEKAINRAAQSGDRELAGKVREGGHRLIMLLNGMLGMSRMYELSSSAFEGPARDLGNVIRQLLDLLGAVHVVCVEDQIYVNDVRLRIRSTEQQVVEHFLAELTRHDIGGFSIHAPMSADAIKALAHTLARPAAAEHPRAAVAARMADLAKLELAGKFRFRLGGEPTAVQRDYAEALRRSESTVREAVASLAGDRLPNPLPVRRVVIDLVDSLKQDPGRAGACSLARHPGGSGEQHLVAVCNLSVALGGAAGLSDAALGDLGVAAMLHDVGYTRSRDPVKHRLAGARLLLRQRGFHEAKVRRLLVVLEHHDHHQPAPASLFSRIVHIADDYDALTGNRSGRRPVSPAVALGSMWAARGRVYDPDLIALFVQVLGPYPPGSLLGLSDGRWVVSVSGGRDKSRFGFPLVRVVREADGTPRQATEAIDLALLRDRLTVKHILDPAQSAVDVAAALQPSPPAPTPA